MISLADLLTETTETEATDLVLEYLTALGFAATSWQPGSWQLHTVAVLARIVANVSRVVPQIARGGYISTATGAWLTLLAYEWYNLTRVPATEAAGQMVLTSTAGAPPHTIAIGQLQIADAASDPANTFRNTTGGTLSPGGTLTLEFAAEVAGVAGNIPTATTLYLWTPLVGVSATNPAIGVTATWLTVPGTDEEADPRLVERCVGQWDGLGYASSDGAYKLWALNADSSVTRVLVEANNPLGPGTVNVVCATAVGGISPTQETDILAYILGDTDGVGRRPLNDVVTVETAAVAGLSVAGWVYVLSGSTTTLAIVQGVITDYCGEVPIGGKIIPPATTGVLVHAELIKRIKELPGVENVILTWPAADLAPGAKTVFVPTFTGLALVSV